MYTYIYAKLGSMRVVGFQQSSQVFVRNVPRNDLHKPHAETQNGQARTGSIYCSDCLTNVDFAYVL